MVHGAQSVRSARRLRRFVRALAACGVAGMAMGATAVTIGATDRPSPTEGAPAPVVDAKTVVLFDGTTWDGWQTRSGDPSPWRLADDGAVEVAGGGDAITRASFGDFQLHLEFRCPVMADATGQARGNSGVYLHGRYEIQVLDSYEQPISTGGCGAIYSISTPSVNACRPPGQWQTYDICFRAPRLDGEGKVTESARVTVLHNGVVIHNNLVLPHTTPGGIDGEVVATGPLLLQDHGNPVRFRNIWIRPLE